MNDNQREMIAEDENTDLFDEVEKDTITLEFTGYEVSGTAFLSLWGGGKSTIQMKPYSVKTLDGKEIWEGVNDNGFGVEKIEGAVCHISKIYGKGYDKYLGKMEFKDGKKIYSSIQE